MSPDFKENVQIRLVCDKPGSRSGWLLILDNITDPLEVQLLIPPVGGHMIVTSCRNDGWEESGDSLDLNVFSREESVLVLSGRVTRV